MVLHWHSYPHLYCRSSFGSTDRTTGLLSTHSRKGVSSLVLYTSPAAHKGTIKEMLHCHSYIGYPDNVNNKFPHWPLAETSKEKSSSTTPSPGLWPSDRQNLDTTSRKKVLQHRLMAACCSSDALSNTNAHISLSHNIYIAPSVGMMLNSSTDVNQSFCLEIQ